jgi:hypothetical protein
MKLQSDLTRVFQFYTFPTAGNEGRNYLHNNSSAGDFVQSPVISHNNWPICFLTHMHDEVECISKPCDENLFLKFMSSENDTVCLQECVMFE